MKKQRQLQAVKNKFSEVVDKAISDGPQIVTRRGKATAVVLSITEYRKLSKRKKETLAELFQRSPFKGIDLKIDRDSSPPPEIKF